MSISRIFVVVTRILHRKWDVTLNNYWYILSEFIVSLNTLWQHGYIISKYIETYRYKNQSQSINYINIGKFAYNIKKYTNLIVNIFSTREKGNFKIFWPSLLWNMSMLAYGNAAKSDSAPQSSEKLNESFGVPCGAAHENEYSDAGESSQKRLASIISRACYCRRRSV